MLKISSVISIIGNILFIVLTTLAMLVCPGGTVEDNTLDKYYFLKKNFSDLGRINALNGELNLQSRAIFMTALILVALVILFYNNITNFK
jgi:hypothetical membrane protein